MVTGAWLERLPPRLPGLSRRSGPATVALHAGARVVRPRMDDDEYLDHAGRLGEGLSIASGRKRPSVFDDDDAVDGSGYPTAVSTGAGAAERASALAARTCSVIQGYVRPMPSSRENRARQPNEYTCALLKFLDCTPTGPGM